MNIINFLQLFFGNYFFRREYSGIKRHVIFNNIDAVNTIGVIFMADSEENFRLVSRFVLLLKKEGVKEIKILGFVNDKQKPSFLNPKLGQDFFMKNELAWNLIPNSTAALNFIHEQFDILIDLSMADIFPLKYILGKSKAHFKAGLGNCGKDEFLDLMINCQDGDGLEKFSNHLLHYIKQINKVDGDVLAMLK